MDLPIKARALQRLRPGCTWGMADNTLASLQWHENNTEEPPSMEEIDAAVLEIQQEDIAKAWEALRVERNKRLAACDFIMCVDVYNTHTEAQQQAWTSYRQALRDLPSTIADLDPGMDNIVWPIRPE